MKKELLLIPILVLVIGVSGCINTGTQLLNDASQAEANQRFVDDQLLVIKIEAYITALTANERCLKEYEEILNLWEMSELGDYSVEELEKIKDKTEKCRSMGRKNVQKHDEVLQKSKEYDAKYGFENHPENIEGIVTIENYEEVNLLSHERLVENEYIYDNNIILFNEEIAYLQGEPSCYDDNSCEWLE